jgi:3'-phosphoadenosine 5'-phosphosulfate sulfotransferase (PAPS reductase)/FAD synthetase
MDSKKDNLLISFSGGKTSAYMTHHILNNLTDKYNCLVCFANTGQEDERSLEFVRDCDLFLGFNTVWLEAVVNNGKVGTTHKITNFINACREGEPFESVIQKYGIPNRDFPHCTRELKIRPIHSFAKMYFDGQDYITAIGIRADEVDRIQKGKFIYPLIKMGVTKQDVNDYWDRMYFTLRLPEHRGNCITCWKKSFKKLKMLADEGEGKWVQEMEQKYNGFIPESQKAGRKLPVNFFREHKNWDDIKNMKSKEAKSEIPNGCSESCEAF